MHLLRPSGCPRNCDLGGRLGPEPVERTTERTHVVRKKHVVLDDLRKRIESESVIEIGMAPERFGRQRSEVIETWDARIDVSPQLLLEGQSWERGTGFCCQRGRPSII